MSAPAPPRPSALLRWVEVVFTASTRGAGLLVVTAVFTMLGVLLFQAWPAFSDSGSNGLLTSAEWVPSPPQGPPQYGALAFLAGTFTTAGIAMLLAIPLGVGTAAFLAEIAPSWLRRTGAFLLELLAAIPSVVYGFWGRFFLAPMVQGGFDAYFAVANWVRGLLGQEPWEPVNTGGGGVLAAGLVLAVMVVPYITAISFDVIRAVPRISREGSLALGASRWQTIWGVVLPTARPGIVAAAFLALGRALGETMAVTMLIGNQPIIPLTPFDQGSTIASKIALSVGEANEPANRSALIALAVVLFAVTAGFNLLARGLLNWLSRTRKTSGVGESEGSREPAELPPPPPPLEQAELTAQAAKARTRAARWNAVMTVVLTLSFLVTVIPLFLILGFITLKGVRAIEPSLFLERERSTLDDQQYAKYRAWREGSGPQPTDDFGDPIERGGLGHAMLGSLILVLGATVFSVPIGLAAAVWLAEARRTGLTNGVRFLVEQLGGVPSIITGLFVYAVLCAPSYSFLTGSDRPLNSSAWAGIVALALIMIPVVIRSAEESMRLVPGSLREASYALGATRMQTTLRVILPASLPAIVTGIFLAVGRIAGETAPLIFTAGQTKFWPSGLEKDTPFLTGYIFRYALSSYADEQDQAWGGTLVLMTVVMLLNVGIRLIAGKRIVSASAG
jgi:phosphate transport system permease protein